MTCWRRIAIWLALDSPRQTLTHSLFCSTLRVLLFHHDLNIFLIFCLHKGGSKIVKDNLVKYCYIWNFERSIKMMLLPSFKICCFEFFRRCRFCLCTFKYLSFAIELVHYEYANKSNIADRHVLGERNCGIVHWFSSRHDWFGKVEDSPTIELKTSSLISAQKVRRWHMRFVDKDPAIEGLNNVQVP